MKTLHISIIITTGITLLGLGIVLLVVRFYLDEFDRQYAQSWNFLHCHTVIPCPFGPYPYDQYLQPLVYFGITICCIGILLILGKILNNRMKSLQK